MVSLNRIPGYVPCREKVGGLLIILHHPPHCIYRNNSPSALELKCIEVWLISCTLFVFLALVEYFVVLFGMRYDKHWRHTKRDLDNCGMENDPMKTGSFNRPLPPLFGSNKVHASGSNATVDNADSVGVCYMYKCIM